MDDSHESAEQELPKKILVTGMTSLRLNAMESDNLGNFIIIEPMFRSLRARFPDASISTTLQLSDAFAEAHGLKILKSKQFYEYTTLNGLKSLFDLVPCLLWRFLNAFGNDAGESRFSGSNAAEYLGRTRRRAAHPSTVALRA